MIWYTVYLTDTDEIVASGTVSKAALGQRHKYTFFKEDIKKEDLPQ